MYIYDIIIHTVLFVIVSRDAKAADCRQLSLVADAERATKLSIRRSFFRTIRLEIRAHRCRVTINLHLAGYPYLLYGSDRPDAASIISRRNYLPSAVNCTCTLCDTISSYDMAPQRVARLQTRLHRARV